MKNRDISDNIYKGLVLREKKYEKDSHCLTFDDYT